MPCMLGMIHNGQYRGLLKVLKIHKKYIETSGQFWSTICFISQFHSIDLTGSLAIKILLLIAKCKQITKKKIPIFYPQNTNISYIICYEYAQNIHYFLPPKYQNLPYFLFPPNPIFSLGSTPSTVEICGQQFV